MYRRRLRWNGSWQSKDKDRRWSLTRIVTVKHLICGLCSVQLIKESLNKISENRTAHRVQEGTVK